MIRIKYFTIVFLVLYIFNPYYAIKAQSDWNYNAAIYGWFAGINGTIGTANHENQFEATLSELLKNMTFTGGGHFEAGNPKLTLIFDLFYYGADKNIDAITIGNNTITPDVSVKLDEWIIEGSFGYKVIEDLNVILSARVFSLNTDFVHSEETLTSVSETWLAFYLGGRYLKNLGDKWYAAVRGDIGYGGDSFAYFVNGAVGYRFNKLFSIALDYRILNMDYSNGEGIGYLKFDATQHGLGLGFVFSF